MSAEASNLCVVCFKTVTIYSIGCCDHVVCFDCSTRMRVLCRQNVCSICRQEMQLVVFTYEVKPFADIQHQARLVDKKYNIGFSNQKIQDAFYKLLEHRCSICKNKTFANFQSLSDHMKREHELFYCDLCLVNIKILSSERKCYSRQDLARHRRKGDPDDTSHRGHPLCEFCDTRYIDTDDLFRHLRRDHLYCHFCDADGLHMYYSSYEHLREHFREEHFLCEEGSCQDEKFTPVFRTEIDFRAHRASEHSRSLGKAAAKQARTLEVEFTLKPRARPQDGRRRGGRNEQGLEEEVVVTNAEAPTPAPTPSLSLNDFPSLGNSSNSTPLTNIVPPIARSGALRIRAVDRNGPQYDQHFPGLPSGSTNPAPTSVRLNINQERKPGTNQNQATVPNVSIHVNHRNTGSMKMDEFPALSTQASPATTTSKWVSVSSKKTPQTPKNNVKPTKPSKPRDEDFPSLSSRFTTNLNFTSSEPLKTDFVNIKSNLNKTTTKAPSSETKPNTAKKASSSLSIVVDGSWPEPAATTSSAKTKSKKKKKGIEEDAVKKKEKTKVEVKPENVQESSAFESVRESKYIDKNESKPLPTAADWFGTSVQESADQKKDEEEASYEILMSTLGLDPSGKKPPPGFAPINGCKGAPPPGFAVPPTNGLMFTNSSGENFPIRPNFPYIPPIDADARNLKLVTKVNEILLNDKNLENFRKKSADFRCGDVTAEDYYQHCLQTMGPRGTSEVLKEMIVLLPDIVKQQELFQILEKHGANNKGKDKLESCSTCQQIVFASELRQHLASHVLSLNMWDFK